MIHFRKPFSLREEATDNPTNRPEYETGYSSYSNRSVKGIKFYPNSLIVTHKPSPSS